MVTLFAASFLAVSVAALALWFGLGRRRGACAECPADEKEGCPR